MNDFRQGPIELECRPVLKDTICRFGEKCFHDIHYLCETDATQDRCIPDDACPFEALVSNLRIDRVERAGNCVRVIGRYDLAVFFRFDDQRRVGSATRDDVAFVVQVPLQNVNDGCAELVCENDERQREVCAFNTRLEIIEATVERDGTGTGDVCEGCEFRIRVVVEKVFRAFEHGLQVLCIPVCPPEACVPPTVPPTTEAPFCPPFTRPTECPSFCEDDEHFFPDNCNQCPPPQVTVPPTTVSPTPPVTTQPPTTQPPTTEPPTTQPPTTQPPTTQPPTTEPPTTQPPTTQPPGCCTSGLGQIITECGLLASFQFENLNADDLGAGTLEFTDFRQSPPLSVSIASLDAVVCVENVAGVFGDAFVTQGASVTLQTFELLVGDNATPGSGLDAILLTINRATPQAVFSFPVTSGEILVGSQCVPPPTLPPTQPPTTCPPTQPPVTTPPPGCCASGDGEFSIGAELQASFRFENINVADLSNASLTFLDVQVDPPIAFNATTFDTARCVNGQARITGSGTATQGATSTETSFTLVVTDNATPSNGLDTFLLILPQISRAYLFPVTSGDIFVGPTCITP